MLQLNIILLIILLPIFIIISTVYAGVKKYIVVETKQIKTFPQKRGYKVLPILEGKHWEVKTVMMKHIIHYF